MPSFHLKDSLEDMYPCIWEALCPHTFPNVGCVPLNSGGFVAQNYLIAPLSPVEDALSSILGVTVLKKNRALTDS